MESYFQGIELNLVITVGILFMTVLVLAFILFFNFSRNKLITKKLKEQEHLLYDIIKTQEAEKQGTSRVLHDEIGSQLNVVKLNLHRLKRKKDDAIIFENTLEDIQVLLGSTIQMVRQISYDLSPCVLEKFGLIAAIKELRDNYKDTNVELSFVIEENTSQINDKSIELNIFRVLQEFIDNAIRCGNATLITVCLSITKQKLQLILKDNRSDVNVNSEKLRTGIGFSNMNSRMEMIGGRINIRSTKNHGIVASLSVNLNE